MPVRRQPGLLQLRLHRLGRPRRRRAAPPAGRPPRRRDLRALAARRPRGCVRRGREPPRRRRCEPSRLWRPAASFDITSAVDLQEVDNAVNQARKEVAQRYDFKGSRAAIELNQNENTIVLTADDEFKMTALWEILQSAHGPARRADQEPDAGRRSSAPPTTPSGAS